MITSAQQVGNELLVTATGEGQATHLGQFTRLANVVISLVDGSAKGTVVFTAANGDHLFVEINAVPTGSPTTVAGTYTSLGGPAGSTARQERRSLRELLRPMVFISASPSRAPYSTERRKGQIPRKNKKRLPSAMGRICSEKSIAKKPAIGNER